MKTKKRIKQVFCRLCGAPLHGYLIQGTIYKFECGAREVVDTRKSVGIRPKACQIIESLGGYKSDVKDEGQVEIPFPKVKHRAK